MSTVLAALDATTVARPVLEVALRMAQLTHSTVSAVHVADGPFETVSALADRLDVPLRVLHGPVEAALLAAIASDDVVAAVLGARARPGDRRPVGHTALELLQQVAKPMVVVPPNAAVGVTRPIHRVLLPLEGEEGSSRPVVERLLPLVAEDIELVVLHVFTPATTPRFLDRPGRDLELLSEEFLTRHLPAAARIELRTGAVGERVGEVGTDEQADLVVLSWSQTMDAGHAGTVRDVLLRANGPVLLLPVDGAFAGEGPLPLDPEGPNSV